MVHVLASAALSVFSWQSLLRDGAGMEVIDEKSGVVLVFITATAWYSTFELVFLLLILFAALSERRNTRSIDDDDGPQILVLAYLRVCTTLAFAMYVFGISALVYESISANAHPPRYTHVMCVALFGVKALVVK